MRIIAAIAVYIYKSVLMPIFAPVSMSTKRPVTVAKTTLSTLSFIMHKAKENAKIKAEAAAKSGYMSIGEDSGLAVTALGGAPGIYSARYAGEHGDDGANNAKLLSELKDKSDRSAKFVCTIACVDEKGDCRYFVGETQGVIIEEKRGEGGFGYDPLFLPEGRAESFAQMSAEDKNAISHRGRAVRALAEFLNFELL